MGACHRQSQVVAHRTIHLALIWKKGRLETYEAGAYPEEAGLTTTGAL
jgi:hypothetical protein